MFTKNLHKTPAGWRHEKKYILSAGIYEVLKRRCAAVMPLDMHMREGGYRVTSLYFDDIYRTAYNDKLGGFLKRCKYRVRAYNLSAQRISLEAKLKEGEHVRKKSALLNLDEYHAIIKADFSFCAKRNSEQFLQNFHAAAVTTGLKPAYITDYFREAFVAEAGNVRITFDRELSAGLCYDGSFDMFKASFTPVLDGGEVVLEVKYDRFIPSYIEELITGYPLMSEPVSKFILSADKNMQVYK
ncbi:MAG: polyphosphate polymerase domain-containing protein [Oscillospiraceae bacterium]|nr:polyphosphate polymerase domain-containing protein [Oscillospiraceae bacterium]